MCFASWPFLLGCKDFLLGTADRDCKEPDGNPGIEGVLSVGKAQIHRIDLTAYKFN